MYSNKAYPANKLPAYSEQSQLATQPLNSQYGSVEIPVEDPGYTFDITCTPLYDCADSVKESIKRCLIGVAQCFGACADACCTTGHYVYPGHLHFHTHYICCYSAGGCRNEGCHDTRCDDDGTKAMCGVALLCAAFCSAVCAITAQILCIRADLQNNTPTCTALKGLITTAAAITGWVFAEILYKNGPIKELIVSLLDSSDPSNFIHALGYLGEGMIYGAVCFTAAALLTGVLMPCVCKPNDPTGLPHYNFRDRWRNRAQQFFNQPSRMEDMTRENEVPRPFSV